MIAEQPLPERQTGGCGTSSCARPAEGRGRRVEMEDIGGKRERAKENMMMLLGCIFYKKEHFL